MRRAFDSKLLNFCHRLFFSNLYADIDYFNSADAERRVRIIKILGSQLMPC
jgi:hypothetical protein